MKSWSSRYNKVIDAPPKVKAFLLEYQALCKRYGLCLSHEDSGGGFIVETTTDYLLAWVNAAAIGESVPLCSEED